MSAQTKRIFWSFFSLLCFSKRGHTLFRVRRGTTHSSTNLRASESGQILVIGAITAVGLAMVSISVANVGMMVAEKIQVQDTVDAATYSAAVGQARYMNLNAYLNRVIVANYNAMAFHTSLWALTDSYDHGFAVTIATLYYIAAGLQIIPFLQGAAQGLDSFANALDQSVHNIFHQANQQFNSWFDQTESDVNNYLEIYNTEVLSTIQGLNYAGIQSIRYQIAKQVAEEMDDEVLTTSVLGLGAEAINAAELAETVDWVMQSADDRSTGIKELNEMFNRTTGTDSDTSDHEFLLSGVTEASLDQFTAGRNRSGAPSILRSLNLANLIPPWITDAIETFLLIGCIDDCIADWISFESCDCDPQVSIVLGSSQRWGEEDHYSENHVPIIAPQRMREAQMFGLDVDLDGLVGLLIGARWGHTSGEVNADIGNYANILNFAEMDRVIECGIGALLGSKCSLNEVNTDMSMYGGGLIGSICSAFGGTGFFDDHWDGSGDAQVACSARWYGFGANICWGEIIDYITQVCQDGVEKGVPRYDWEVDLDDVGIPHYIGDETNAEVRPDGNSRGGSFAGPSVAVVGVKKQEDINGLHGLGIGNEYNISAIARGQVYYLRSPMRPDEKPSMFNPHWVARLAPLDNDDNPSVFKEGLPWLMSHGLPIDPTH